MELFLEIRSEEIPARLQRLAHRNLAKRLVAALEKHTIQGRVSTSFATPRRLIVVVSGLPPNSQAKTNRIRGPKADAHPRAIEGFIRKIGFDTDDILTSEPDKSGTNYLFATKRTPGKRLAEIVGEILPDVLIGMKWARSMHWNATSVRWIRPVRGLCCAIFAEAGVSEPGASTTGDVEPVQFSFAGLTSAPITVGHRIMAPDPIEITPFSELRQQYIKSYVLIDELERADRIRTEAHKLASANNQTVSICDQMLTELAGLTEWPVVLKGSFDQEFLSLPDIVIKTVIEKQQRCLTLSDQNSQELTSDFLIISDIAARDEGKTIIAGNERVVRARLSDALFFWNRDRDTRLEDRVTALASVGYHKNLGSTGEHVRRIEILAGKIARLISDGSRWNIDPDMARRAARLCKADLTTLLVREFPVLEGNIGAHFARNDGEPELICTAISEHRLPASATDRVPETPVGMIIALAVKIDRIVGFWLIGELPSGSRDPFGLRRDGRGIVRIIEYHKLGMDISIWIDEALAEFPGESGTCESRKNLPHSVGEFLLERARTTLIETDIPHDVVDASFERHSRLNIWNAVSRTQKLAGFLATPEGMRCRQAIKRGLSIPGEQSEFLFEPGDAGLFSRDEFPEKTERTLYDRTIQVEEILIRNSKKADAFDNFTFEPLSFLTEAIDTFFEFNVINHKDESIRKRRIWLLWRLEFALNQWASFRKLDG